MRSRRMKLFYSCLAAVGMVLAIRSSPAADREMPIPPVQMTVTASVANGKRMPDIDLDNAHVKHGNERLEVTDCAPARGARAGLDLSILIDDASFGSQLDAPSSMGSQQRPGSELGISEMRRCRSPSSSHRTTLRLRMRCACRWDPLGPIAAPISRSSI
jgi:hypothetical protein